MTNIDILKDWVAALRSGKFEQGTGYLNAHNKFCCLGVLCEICQLEKEIYDNHVYRYSYKCNHDYECDLPTHSSSKTQLPQLFADKLGIESFPTVPVKVIWPNEKDEKVRISLAQLNDDRTILFAGIADIIEKYLIPTVQEKTYD